MSTTATLEIPQKTAKAVKRQRAYDYLYGKCMLQPGKRPHLQTYWLG